MAQVYLSDNAERMGAEIIQANTAQRRVMQPEFSRVLAGLKKQGLVVPAHLAKLDAELVEEKIEAQFDNMPV